MQWGNSNAARPAILLYAKNSGQTPARWFSANSKTFVVNLKEDGTSEGHDFGNVDLSGRKRKRWNALGGGDELSFIAYNADDIGIMQAAYGRKDVSLNIAGILRYETFFGEIFESEFYFTVRPVPEFRFEKTDVSKKGLAQYGVPEKLHNMQRASCILNSYVHIRKRWWREKPTT